MILINKKLKKIQLKSHFCLKDIVLYCIVKPGAMPGFSFIEPCAEGYSKALVGRAYDNGKQIPTPLPVNVPRSLRLGWPSAI